MFTQILKPIPGPRGEASQNEVFFKVVLQTLGIDFVFNQSLFPDFRLISPRAERDWGFTLAIDTKYAFWWLSDKRVKDCLKMADWSQRNQCPGAFLAGSPEDGWAPYVFARGSNGFSARLATLDEFLAKEMAPFDVSIDRWKHAVKCAGIASRQARELRRTANGRAPICLR